MNKTLWIIALIAVVNALGYGIIIPVLYSYSQKFGLTDFENGLLFSLFSVCQFIATPIIGRLSDVYGRKPLLLISVSGTAVSFLLMAIAPSAAYLFLARALDGLTAGNIPVASAVISDTTEPKNRARGFGIIGASFSLGFILGPAISALTIPFGPQVPFFIAAAVSALAAVLTAAVLPESHRHSVNAPSNTRQSGLSRLLTPLVDPHVGPTLVLTLLYSFAFSLYTYGFQPYAVKVLALTPAQISLLFVVLGVIGLVGQTVIIPRVVRRFGERRSLVASFITVCATFAAFALIRHVGVFTGMFIVNALAHAFIGPLIQTLLSMEVDAQSQGSILGINSSYMSIGMIFGPVAGGLLATYALNLPFAVGSLVTVATAVISVQILRTPLSERARLHIVN